MTSTSDILGEDRKLKSGYYNRELCSFRCPRYRLSTFLWFCRPSNYVLFSHSQYLPRCEFTFRRLHNQELNITDFVLENITHTHRMGSCQPPRRSPVRPVRNSGECDSTRRMPESDSWDHPGCALRHPAGRALSVMKSEYSCSRWKIFLPSKSRRS